MMSNKKTLIISLEMFIFQGAAGNPFLPAADAPVSFIHLNSAQLYVQKSVENYTCIHELFVCSGSSSIFSSGKYVQVFKNTR